MTDACAGKGTLCLVGRVWRVPRLQKPSTTWKQCDETYRLNFYIILTRVWSWRWGVPARRVFGTCVCRIHSSYIIRGSEHGEISSLLREGTKYLSIHIIWMDAYDVCMHVCMQY